MPIKIFECPALRCRVICDSVGGSGHLEHTEIGSPDNETESSEGIHVLESLVLAHACAGIDIESEKYQEGIRTALDALTNWTS